MFASKLAQLARHDGSSVAEHGEIERCAPRAAVQELHHEPDAAAEGRGTTGLFHLVEEALLGPLPGGARARWSRR